MKMTGAQIIVYLLQKAGINMVAGIPGGSVLPLYEELYKSTIRHILVRHEQSAGFIAQGIARTTGKAAVCIATSGPGAMNLLTAIADARSDSIPLVAITGQVNTALIGTDAFQEADTFGLSFPITKHSVMVKNPLELLEVIPEAFRIAASGRPGPVLIDVPRDVQAAFCEFTEWPDIASPVFKHDKDRYYTTTEDKAVLVEKFAQSLLSAKKPVLYVGGGCNSPDGAAAVNHFLDIYPLPVVTSLMGIGSLSRSNAMHIGMVGMHGAYAANRALYDADLVLAVGARFDDRATGLVSKFCPHAQILQIDIDAAEVNKILTAHMAIVSEAASVLPVLAACMVKEKQAVAARYAEFDADRNKWLSHIQNMKTASQADVSGRPDDSEEQKKPDPRIFIQQVPAAAEKAGVSADSIIVTTDVGQHQMWCAQYYPVEKPRHFLTSGSLGTMGFGLPVSLGAALANPDKRIVCFSGDGSIMMNIQELATLAELNLSVTVIVLDNGALGMVRQQQKILFHEHYSACIFSKQPDLLAIAAGFGIRSVDANTDPRWYETAFLPGPCFVRLKIAMDENVYPFVPSGKANIDAIL